MGWNPSFGGLSPPRRVEPFIDHVTCSSPLWRALAVERNVVKLDGWIVYDRNCTVTLSEAWDTVAYRKVRIDIKEELCVMQSEVAVN